MKYRDPDTGELKDIYVKASDTLPIGAEVDYNGTEVPSGWEEVDNPNDYSIDEKVVGKWIDGKLVYEKTVIYTHSRTIGKLNEMVTIDIPHGISNFEHVVDDVKGFSSTGNVLPLLNGTSSTTQSVNIAFVNAANIQMRIINVQITARTWYLTLRYTKTTDSITTTSSDEQINEEATI